MYEKIEHCPVCNNTEFTNEIICEDTTVSKEQFNIVRCSSCEFIFTNPRPAPDFLGNYYDSNTYISHNSKGVSLIKLIYKIARSLAFKSKYQLIKRYVNENKTLLDYGCGSGHFLSYCNKQGIKITGIEPNNDARKTANEITKNAVVNSISKLDQTFQVITLWHVLEHIPNLNETVDLLKKKLNKNGTLIVAVPNVEAWDAQHYKNNWAAYDVPRHLYHFSQSSLKNLMKKHSLKIKEVIPMKMDSYYVSMLSEKNRTGNNNYFRSIINGLKSNKHGAKNNNNYSSLIYIIKK